MKIEIEQEKYEVPPAVERVLRLAGGVNRFGEPNYRAVWGWNRLAWIGGKFEERNPATGALLREVVELRREPKYPQVNRWHIERWVPPEAYGSPRTWYAQTVERADGESVAALGPYPHRGEYEHCFTLEGANGEFIQLTATIAERIAQAIEWSRSRPRAERRDSFAERAQREEQNYDRWAYEALDAGAPAFDGAPFVTVG